MSVSTHLTSKRNEKYSPPPSGRIESGNKTRKKRNRLKKFFLSLSLSPFSAGPEEGISTREEKGRRALKCAGTGGIGVGRLRDPISLSYKNHCSL